MFEGFETLKIHTRDVKFAGVIGGSGPPVLLLHGYPQTHIAWRFVAPVLAERYRVIVPDLPGYGDSRILKAHTTWTKRQSARTLVDMMDALGHSKFAVVGHDRGARVGYRLALDFVDRVCGYTSLTVIPTLDAFAAVDSAFAINAFHWFMLAQPNGLPERLLAADPIGFIDATLLGMAGSLERFEPDALKAYRAAFNDPAVRHAICEDYRAAAFEDREIDAADIEAGRKLQCPVSVLWPKRKTASGSSPIDIWRRWADDVSGYAVDGGHLLPEFSPDAVIEHLLPFLARVTA